MAYPLLYQKEYRVTESITIHIPTVEEILRNEKEYYGAVSLLIATPYDMMVQLDESGIDFTQINEWDLFCLLFHEIQRKDFKLVFNDLDFKAFKPCTNSENKIVSFINEENGAVLDRGIHHQICETLRDILYIQKNVKYPANDEAKAFMIERARKKLSRQRNKRSASQLEKYIIALVNTAEFSYTYDSVLDITIYQFYMSLRQIIRKIRFDNLMIGCYAGTINTKELSQEELNWITN